MGLWLEGVQWAVSPLFLACGWNYPCLYDTMEFQETQIDMRISQCVVILHGHLNSQTLQAGWIPVIVVSVALPAFIRLVALRLPSRAATESILGGNASNALPRCDTGLNLGGGRCFLHTQSDIILSTVLLPCKRPLATPRLRPLPLRLSITSSF
ncbi:hypothetical protein F5144DRAFT_397232 [Chaetomium tenue]|uniref:Uncharacterized protein n=1 Tax=Chaetomium tenue TaxID=1854479 RepID=A0ACB7NWD2_9PEZI|nr:hypothetical protein F5144DRAFT_397232 [Chaetomium globosum]